MGESTALLLILLFYVAIGACLGTTALGIPASRRSIVEIAGRHGMSRRCAGASWLGGTLIAWPVGLYVLATGRLVLVDVRKPSVKADYPPTGCNHDAPITR